MKLFWIDMSLTCINTNYTIMKNKILTLLFAATMVTISASSQTIKDNIDKVMKDKNREEKSAKADVLIHKKVIYDSVQIKPIPSKTVSTKTTTQVTKVKQKKHKYKKKTNHS